MRARIERTLAVGALSGDGPERVLANLAGKGMTVLARLRDLLTPAQAKLLPQDRVRIGLSRGASVYLLLRRPAKGTLSTAAAGGLPLVELVTRRRRSTAHHPPIAGAAIAKHVHGDMDAALRALLGIERARKLLCASFEESSRWLPT